MVTDDGWSQNEYFPKGMCRQTRIGQLNKIQINIISFTAFFCTENYVSNITLNTVIYIKCIYWYVFSIKRIILIFSEAFRCFRVDSSFRYLPQNRKISLITTSAVCDPHKKKRKVILS